MKTIKDPSQRELFDPFEGVIGPMGWKQIASGWQGLFRETILELMPVDSIGADLSEDTGRPSAELYAMVGLLLIREFQGWTVPQTHEAILFRADIQYALNLQPGYELTQRTIERYLEKMQKNDSISEHIFSRVADQLLQQMEVKVKKQRLDSTHVLSDMATFGRAQMIGVALRRFFRKVRKHDETLLECFADELLARYDTPSDNRIFGDARTAEQRKVALQQAAEDLCMVICELSDVDPICHWDRFVQLQTIFNQQCELREEFVEVRAKTGGNVIVNPSDPDATYSGHKGAGYQVQIAETFNEEGQPNFLTAAKVETAVDSDSDAVGPVLEDLEQRDQMPEELLADSGYGGDGNVQMAASQGVDLVAPVAGCKKYDNEELGYDSFELNESHEVVACPAGHAPKSTRFNAKQDYVWAQMDADQCVRCPLLAHCRVQRNRKTNTPTGRIQFQLSAIRCDVRRRNEQTEGFRNRYRWRSGIEATNGCLKRMMGLGRLRVRGLRAVKHAILMKLTGWNILRAVALRQHRKLAGITIV